MSNKPRRAHQLIAKFEADTVQDLADELYGFAQMLERGEVTQGVKGGPDSSAIYSYSADLSITHDSYFEKINNELRQRAEGEQT